MQFFSSILGAFALATAVVQAAPATGSVAKTPYYYQVIGGYKFVTHLKNGNRVFLSVFDDSLILTPHEPVHSAWWFKKTEKTASFDTFWFGEDNRVAVYLRDQKRFTLRKTNQVFEGQWNLTTPPSHLKFMDSTEFRACAIRDAFTKRLTLREGPDPAWAFPGTCEDVVLKCLGCTP